MLSSCKIVEPFFIFTCSHHDKTAQTLVGRDDVQQGRVFFTLCILKHFIDIIRPDNDFKQNLLVLLKKYPMIDTQAMGFVDNWLEQPLWES